MAKPINLANWANNYEKGMNNAQEKYKQGIGRVVDNPMAKAAQKKDKAVANYTRSADRMAAKLLATPMERWKNNATTTGAERLVSGAKKARPKLQAYISEYGPQIQALRDRVDAMPSDSDADKEQRMLEWTRGMRQIKNGGQ